MTSRDHDLSPSCEALISDLHDIHRTSTDEAAVVARISERLAVCGEERRWLKERYRKVGVHEYAQHLMYVAPNRRFSVVALTWGPGAQTCIHDHAGWCVVAVYEGVEYEKRYRICADARDKYLVETESRALEVGRTIGMLADGLDIHRVGNYSREVTISLHVYGVDIERVGSSIKSRYDDLRVRS